MDCASLGTSFHLNSICKDPPVFEDSLFLATSFVSASMLRRTASDMGGTRAEHQSDQKGLVRCWTSQSGRIFD